jgi:hypothetical protein
MRPDIFADSPSGSRGSGGRTSCQGRSRRAIGLWIRIRSTVFISSASHPSLGPNKHTGVMAPVAPGWCQASPDPWASVRPIATSAHPARCLTERRPRRRRATWGPSPSADLRSSLSRWPASSSIMYGCIVSPIECGCCGMSRSAGNGRAPWPGPHLGLAGRAERSPGQGCSRRILGLSMRMRFTVISSVSRHVWGPLTRRPGRLRRLFCEDGMSRRRSGRHPKVDLRGGIFRGGALARRCHRFGQCVGVESMSLCYGERDGPAGLRRRCQVASRVAGSHPFRPCGCPRRLPAGVVAAGSADGAQRPAASAPLSRALMLTSATTAPAAKMMAPARRPAT